MTGFAEAVTEASNHLAHQALEAGHPGLPLLAILCLSVTCAIGLPGARPGDDRVSASILWWRLRIAAFAGTLLFWLLTICHLVLAERLLGDGAARWFLVDWAGRWGLLGLALIGLAVSSRILAIRYGLTWLSKQLRAHRNSQETEALSDVRHEAARWAGAQGFDPRNHYRPGIVFTGLAPDGQPVSIPVKTALETMKCVIGATRFGKGVTFQVWADQAVQRGDCVIFVDPKGDDFLPVILRSRAEAMGREFLLVDLRETGAGRWAPLEHGPLEERIIRMTELLGLKERGTDADHYKILAASVIREVMAELPRTSLGAIADALERRDLSEGEWKALLSPREKLKRLARRPSLTPRAGRGLDLDRVIRSNAVLYVIGDIDDDEIRLAARTLLVEVAQLARRLRHERTAPLSLFVDELKFMASAVILRVLAAAAYTGLNLNLAFQSFADLLKPDDESLDGRAVLQAVLTNCQVKLFFGGSDVETAEWVQAASGTRPKRVTRLERTEVGAYGGERWEDGRTVGEIEEPLIHANTILTLPRGHAVLFQPERTASLVQVQPIRIPETEAIAAKAVTAAASA
jgi:hypothetical protein